MTTSFLLPTAVTYNGTGVNGWANPDNILLVDNEYAVSTGATCILQVGNFNLSIPQDSNITNFTIRIKGYRGSFNTTLQLYAIDNTTGVELSYPAAPFQSFSGTNTLFTLPSTLFGTTWTVDQANNIQIKLIADGELHMDAIEISADYVPQVTPVPVPPSTGDVVVDEFVQGQRFLLASSITSSDLYAFTQSFTLPDGTPIQYADFYGEALITMDQGIPGYEENIRLTAIDHNYQGTGLTRLSFGSINNRGLKFIYPYDHDINLCVPHNGTAEFVISNSAPFYDRFLKKNQINALVSAPIIVEDEGSALTDPAHTLDFQGAGVSVVNDGGDSFKKIITIPGNGTNPPNVVTTSSSTSGASQVPSLTWSHVSSGLNRLLVVQVSTEAAATVSGVTYNGVALTQAVTTTNGTLKTQQWYLIAPAVGTYNIIVSVTPNAYITAGAETLNTVDQSSPIGVTQTATGTSLTPSLVLATGTDNSLVIDSLATGTLPMVYTAGAGQTENWHITATPNTRQGASSIEPAGTQPDNVTMSWAITQNVAWALNAIEVKGIAGPSGITVEDEGTPLATTAQTLNFVGAGVTATGTGTTKTITIPGGGSALSLETDGTPNGDQTLLNLAAGTNITLTDNGTGTVTIDATGGSADELVAVSAADTTPGYLQPKLNIHSSDGSVTVTETITNPAGNEVLDIDLTGASGGGSPIVFNNGETIKDTSDASTTQTIAHGLGQTPTNVRITFIAPSGTSSPQGTAVLSYNGTTASVVGFQFVNGACRDMAGTDIKLYGTSSGSEIEFQTGVITMDATNISIAWTKTNSPTGVWNMMWEAEAGGTGGSIYTVNTDETVSTWYTIPIASPFSGSVATETFWIISGTLILLATGSTLTSTGLMYAYGALQDMATGSTGGALNFAAGTSIRVKNIVLLPQGTDVSGGGNYRSSFFGFSESGTADSGDITDVGIRRVGFGAYNGNLYAICATGAAITSTSLGAYATDINNLYEIILNGTTSADFYINGSLVATINTNLPTANPIYIQLQRTNSPGGSYTMFMSNITYSQEL